jgi:hypothetical protein
MPSNHHSDWESTKEEREDALHRGCHIHPEYEGGWRPVNACVWCIMIWASKQAQRYAQADRQRMEDLGVTA